MPTEHQLLVARAQETVRGLAPELAKICQLTLGNEISIEERTRPKLKWDIDSFRRQIAERLPLLIYSFRQDLPQPTILAIPLWKDSGNPFSAYLLAEGPSPLLSEDGLMRLRCFSEAVWIAFEKQALPALAAGGGQSLYLLKSWTGPDLFN